MIAVPGRRPRKFSSAPTLKYDISMRSWARFIRPKAEIATVSAGMDHCPRSGVSSDVSNSGQPHRLSLRVREDDGAAVGAADAKWSPDSRVRARGLIKSHAGRFDTGLLMLVSGLCRFEAGVGSGETRPSFSRSTCRSSSDPCATQFTNYKLAAGAIRASGN